MTTTTKRMAQADLNKFNFKLGEDGSFSFDLCPGPYAKRCTIRYSKHYKGQIINIEINKNKSFVITTAMWKILRNHSDLLDNFLQNESGIF